jgi:hypothetical protein
VVAYIYIAYAQCIEYVGFRFQVLLPSSCLVGNSFSACVYIGYATIVLIDRYSMAICSIRLVLSAAGGHVNMGHSSHVRSWQFGL